MKQFLTGISILASLFCFSQTITSAEYFFNTDPGVGSGNAITVNSNTGQLTQTLSIPTTSLSNGFHSVYVRTQGSNGRWSLYDRQNFYLAIIEDTNITAIEYFFDTDNGVGTGTEIVAETNTGQLTQTLSMPTSSLSNGFHNLYIRTQGSNGKWSLYDRQHFYLANIESNTISAAEYFFNTDPGVGNGTTLGVSANSGQLMQIFSVPTTGLSEGFHSFYLRTQSNNGNWSLYDRQIIYIKDFDLTPDEVSAAEYFIDSDPGIGNGTAVVFGNASQTTQTLNINSTGLAEGEHLFYVRVQDANGDWSIYDSAVFTIDSSLSTADSLFELVKLYPTPFVNKLTIKTPNNLEITKTEVYNSLGQTVYSSFESKKTLELSTLQSGMYILNLKTDLGSASFKIVKQ